MVSLRLVLDKLNLSLNENKLRVVYPGEESVDSLSFGLNCFFAGVDLKRFAIFSRV